MTNSWMNEDGEPIMDAAAWRFEQQLDIESAAERVWDLDSFDDCDENHQCEDCGECVDECVCDDRDDDPDEMEDAWLDGSYEQ